MLLATNYANKLRTNTAQINTIKATNITYNELKVAVAGALNNLGKGYRGFGGLGKFLTDIQDLSHTNNKALLIKFNRLLRYYPKPKGVLVQTYTYKPIVGMPSSTDEKGTTTYYEYDALGRLIETRDDDSNLVSKNKYHYKEQAE